MDPNATLQRIIDAAYAGDADEVRSAANDLADWLDRGGFPPTDPAVAEFNRMLGELDGGVA